jgi:hypothetical protein
MKLNRSPESQESKSFKTSEIRYSVMLNALLLADTSEQPILARVFNISAGGMMAVVKSSLVVGERIVVTIRHAGKFIGRVVWSKATTIGIKFDKVIDPLRLLTDRAKLALEPGIVANAFVASTTSFLKSEQPLLSDVGRKSALIPLTS